MGRRITTGIGGAATGAMALGGFFGPYGAAVGLLGGFVLGYVSAPSSYKQSPTTMPQFGIDELEFNTNSEIIPVPIVYGRCKLTGNIIERGNRSVEYQTVIMGSSESGGKGGKDEPDVETKEVPFRYTIPLLYGICEAPIEGVRQVWINDRNVSDGMGCYWQWTQNGENEAFSGVENTYPYYQTVLLVTRRFSYDLNQVPNMTAEIDGLKVSFFGRDRQFSQNPAEILADLMTDQRYGLGLPLEWLDEASFIKVAKICNEPHRDFQGNYQTRFQCDIVINEDRSVVDVIKDILSSFAGFLAYYNGKYYLGIEIIEDPVYSFDESNIIRGSFSYWKNQSREQPNQVEVIFECRDKQEPSTYKRSSVVVNLEHDQNATREIRKQSYELTCVKREFQAALLADYYLRAPLQNTFCSFKTDARGLLIKPGDVISVTHSLPSWTNKRFRVIAVREAEKFQFEITCRELFLDVREAGVETYASSTEEPSITSSQYEIPSPVGLIAKEARNNLPVDRKAHVHVFPLLDGYNKAISAQVFVSDGLNNENTSESSGLRQYRLLSSCRPVPWGILKNDIPITAEYDPSLTITIQRTVGEFGASPNPFTGSEKILIDNEVFYVGSAQLIDENTYELSDLVRACYDNYIGSSQITTHSAGTKVIRLSFKPVHYLASEEASNTVYFSNKLRGFRGDYSALGPDYEVDLLRLAQRPEPPCLIHITQENGKYYVKWAMKSISTGLGRSRIGEEPAEIGFPYDKIDDNFDHFVVEVQDNINWAWSTHTTVQSSDIDEETGFFKVELPASTYKVRVKAISPEGLESYPVEELEV